MSGGSLGSYGFYELNQAQADLRREIDAGEYSPATVSQLEAIITLMQVAESAWKDADWLVSGDTGESSWLSETTAAALAAAEHLLSEGYVAPLR